MKPKKAPEPVWHITLLVSKADKYLPDHSRKRTRMNLSSLFASQWSKEEQAKSFILTFASELKLDWRIQRRLLYLLNLLLCLSDMLTDTYLITQEKELGWMHTAFLLHREEKKNLKKCYFLTADTEQVTNQSIIKQAKSYIPSFLSGLEQAK